MGLLGAWQKRLISYFILGFVPLLIVYVALLLNLGVLIAFLGGFILSIGGMFIVHRVTLNALASYELNQTPMLQTLDSLGVLNFYPMFVSPEDRIASAKVYGKPVATPYSTANLFEAIFHKKQVPAWSDETHMHILIPKQDAYTHTFNSRGVTTFVFNRRGNWFWTKSGLSGVEDGLTLENTVAYLAHSTKNFEESTRNYARSAVDKLWEKFNTPALWMLAVAVLVIIVLVVYGGDIISFATGAVNGSTGAVSQANSALAPVEATQALG